MSADRSRLPEPGPRRGFALPAAERATLGNGLGVRTVRHGGVPVIAMLLLVRAGSATDPDGQYGLAALTADLLDEGCGSLSARDFHEALASIGGVLDIETGCDATAITLVTLAAHRDRALGLLADLAFEPRFDERDFNRVRDLRVNRIAQLEDVPSAVADRTLIERLYGSHPYGHLPIGTDTSLRAVTRDTVAEFHGRRFVPATASLIVVGDLVPSETLDATASVLGARMAGDASPAVTRPFDQSRRPADPRLVIVDRPGAPQSELRIGRVATSRSAPDVYELLVLNAVLGGQFMSRINLKLREERGLTYGARSAFDFRRAAGPFSVQTSVQTDGTAEAMRHVLEALDEVGGPQPATDEELELARAALTRGYAKNFETAEQVARALAHVELHGLSDRYYEEFPSHIDAVGASSVTSAAARWLHPSTMTIVVVGDRARVAADLAPFEGS
jgi:predicted Zn-dependent peptidase